MSVFKRSATMVRKSGMVIVVWLISLTITVIGAAYFCEDFMTSVKGYQMVPTRHHYDFIIWIGALTPQVGMVFFAYLAADQPNRWWAWLASFTLLLVDSATDLLFKHVPGPGQAVSIAASTVEILIMYNLCSEGFLALGTGLTLELFPDMITALRNLRSRLARPSHGWGMLGNIRGRPRSPALQDRPRPQTQSRTPGPRPRAGDGLQPLGMGIHADESSARRWQ